MNVGWNPQKLFANLLRSCKSLWGYTINSSYVGLKLLSYISTAAITVYLLFSQVDLI